MPDGRFARHRKLHAFVSEHLSCGDEFTVFDTPFGCRVGVLICYDNNLVENVRITALLGAELLLAPHQTGGCKTVSPHAMGLVDPAKWDRRAQEPAAIEAEFRGPKGREWVLRWLPSRAHDNGLFLVFANGVGRDGDEIRTGGALVLDPYGRILGLRAADPRGAVWGRGAATNGWPGATEDWPDVAGPAVARSCSPATSSSKKPLRRPVGRRSGRCPRTPPARYEAFRTATRLSEKISCG
jgi:hypothetical protein